MPFFTIMFLTQIFDVFFANFDLLHFLAKSKTVKINFLRLLQTSIFYYSYY